MRLVGVEGLTDQLGLRVQGGEAGDFRCFGFHADSIYFGSAPVCTEDVGNGLRLAVRSRDLGSQTTIEASRNAEKESDT